MKLIKTYLAFYLIIHLFSCTKDTGINDSGNYPKEVGALILSKCATSGCHNSKSYQAASNLNLETWESLFLGSESGSAVIPFSSQFSSLCYYINTYPELGSQNQPTMPLNNTKLSKSEMLLIKNWIDAGAPDINGNIKWASYPNQKKLYLVNQGCDVVTVLDSETQLPIRYIKVGNKLNSTPHQIRVSPDGKYWYVLFINHNILQKYKCSDDSYLGDIPLTPFAAGTSNQSIDNAQDWNTFVISKDSKKAYCVSYTNNGKIAAVDLENKKLIHYLPGFSYPHGIALNDKEDTLYITSQYGNYITKLDSGFSYKQEFSIQPGVTWNNNSLLDPHDIILAPNKQEFLITCQKSNEVRVFNIANNSINTIISTGIFPQEIIFSKTRNEFFVSCTNDTIKFINSHGLITKINANNYQDVKHLACGFQPHGIAADESKNLLYVLSRNISAKGPLPHHTSQCSGKNGFVNFIDLSLFSLLPKKYELSVDPYYIFAQP